MIEITLNVNDEEHNVRVAPYENLRDVLRNKLGFIDVKTGCGEGECGGCTVLLDGVPVTSCLIPAVQAEGAKFTTVQGIAINGKLILGML